MWKAVRAQEAVVPLAPNEEIALRAELDKAGLALVHARYLVEFSTGRHAARLASESGPQLNGVSAARQVRRIAELLWLDAALRANDRQRDLALQSCRALLVVGRSAGDDPDLGLQLVRRSTQHLACTGVERVLAQGVAEEKALTEMQKLLQDEATQPVLRYALRGYRAWTDEVMKGAQNGNAAQLLAEEDEHKIAVAEAQQDTFGFMERALKSGWLKENRALALEFLTDAVELTNLPIEKQPEALDQLEASCQNQRNGSWLPGRYVPGTNPMIAAVAMSRSFQRSQAELRCASAGLAAERFRLLNDRWPNAVAELEIGRAHV